jgi:hypothetical protein
MQVYGRFLEIVRAEPGAAARYYEAALKAGTSESLLALTAAEGGAAGLSAAGQIDEKVDGLAVINAQVRNVFFAWSPNSVWDVGQASCGSELC